MLPWPGPLPAASRTSPSSEELNGNQVGEYLKDLILNNAQFDIKMWHLLPQRSHSIQGRLLLIHQESS
jgi:hypothetical protein